MRLIVNVWTMDCVVGSLESVAAQIRAAVCVQLLQSSSSPLLNLTFPAFARAARDRKPRNMVPTARRVNLSKLEIVRLNELSQHVVIFFGRGATFVRKLKGPRRHGNNVISP